MPKTKAELIEMIVEATVSRKFRVMPTGEIRTTDSEFLCGDCPLLAAAKHQNPDRFRHYRNLDFSQVRFGELPQSMRDIIRETFGHEYGWIIKAADFPSHPDRATLMRACGLGSIQ